MAFDRFIYIIGLLVISFNPIVHGSVNVETGIGTIIGSQATVKVNNIDYTLKTFLGIPYARPPIGDLRLQRPEPMPGFDSPFEAVNFGKACLQPEFPGQPVYNQSEDCLYLNVYVPEQVQDKESGHAVMVFIHGGGFMMGAGETYAGEELCSFGNVIVVTINYRLGVFGFMDSGDGTVPGNLAFHDQHLALKWVNANIGAFGGDNKRVTIFGESAGGTSVVIQGMYPSNKGLIHRVIAQSGCYTASSLIQHNPGDSCLTLAKELGCDGTSINDAISCIKATDANTIMNTMQEMSKDPQKAMAIQFMPSVDGEIIKILPSIMSSQSKIEELEQVEFFRSLDFISGVTNLEGGVFLLMQMDLETFTISREDFITKYVPMVLAMAGGPVSDVVKSLVIAEYTNWTNPNLPENNRDQYVRLVGDLYFTAGTAEISRLHSNVSDATQNTYAYLFSAKPTNHFLKTPTWFKGANHGDDMGFVFLFAEKMIDAVLLGREIKPFADWEYKLAYDAATYWTNFAKSGNPNEPVEVPAQWPRYEPVDQQYVILDRDMSENSIGNHLYARERNLWLETIPEVNKAMDGSHDHDTSSPFVKTSTRDGSCSADGKCEVAQYELFYFDIRGRGQPIRYLFEDQGLKYKDVSVDPWDKWESTYKSIAPFGLCPFLNDGDFQMAESNAILRYLGRKHGLHPEDVKESARIDMINDNIEDIRKKYSDVVYSENYEADRDAFDKTLPDTLQRLETQLNGEKSDYILPKITFVDYNLFDMLDILQQHSPGCLDKYPSLAAYLQRVADRPAMKQYRLSEGFKRLKVNYNDYV